MDLVLTAIGIGAIMYILGVIAGIVLEKISQRINNNEKDIARNDAEQN